MDTGPTLSKVTVRGFPPSIRAKPQNSFEETASQSFSPRETSALQVLQNESGIRKTQPYNSKEIIQKDQQMYLLCPGYVYYDNTDPVLWLGMGQEHSRLAGKTPGALTLRVA